MIVVQGGVHPLTALPVGPSRDIVPTVCVFVKPIRIATYCPAMVVLNEHMRVFSTSRGSMGYSGSSITLNPWPRADLTFGLELLSKPMSGALRRDVLFIVCSNKK